MDNATIGGALLIAALLCAAVGFVHATAPAVRRRLKPTPDQAPPKETTMQGKQTSRALARLAAKTLRDPKYRPTKIEADKLAASVLSQYETDKPKAAASKKAAKVSAPAKRARKAAGA